MDDHRLTDQEPFNLQVLHRELTKDSPFNPWERLNALHKVWVANASIFSMAGDRHPTLTILALALCGTPVVQWLEA